MKTKVRVVGICGSLRAGSHTHQALAVAFGGRVDRARLPMHGKTSKVAHEGANLFAGLSSPFEAGRYHSLIVARDPLPNDFVVSAWTTDDETIMAMRHVRWPVYGVQFHPESVLTPVGHRVLQNFLGTH